MDQYLYAGLDEASEEIRLVDLMPGREHDDICFSIFHVSLHPPSPTVETDMVPTDQLQETLPEGWVVKETLEGRYLFMRLGSSGVPNSWDHPDNTVERASYDMEVQKPKSDFEPNYEALSYTWGSTWNSVEVYVVDTTHPSPSRRTMNIGDSLATCFRYLRYRDRPRRLWVDAICINQADIHERNIQVRRMGMIYSLANRVVIWVGEAGFGSSHAMSTLKYIGEQIEVLVDHFFGDAPGAMEPTCRVWVIQESQLVNRLAIVQCGYKTVRWYDIWKAVFCITDKLGVPPELNALLRLYGSNFWIKSQALNLSTLLNWSKGRQCTDPRDKVYGILNLMSPSLSRKINPNYTRPVIQAYKELFLADLKINKRLDLLFDCRIKHQLSGSPSWLPNWAAPSDSSLFGRRVSYVRPTSCYSTALAEHVSPDTLKVIGKQCAHLSFVGPVARKGEDILNLILHWQPISMHTETYVAGGPLLEAFLEIIFLGWTRDRFPLQYGMPRMEELKCEYHKAFARTPPSFSGLANFEAIQLDDMALIRTHDGHLGLSPQGAKEGDIVTVLLGCDRLMLLRPNSAGRFLVVGPCYVHGFMDGEGILGPLESPWELKFGRGSTWDVPGFYNTETGEVTENDPRLPPLSDRWEATKRKRMHGEPFFFKEFRDKITGHVIKQDPRVLPDALQARSCGLETMLLI
ncbi:HET-domain-containing protein [Xylariaceae sp. FL1651]|nr:HET-domain-containing protein [Xylariaceae sp. FL1651]